LIEFGDDWGAKVQKLKKPSQEWGQLFEYRIEQMNMEQETRNMEQETRKKKQGTRNVEQVNWIYLGLRRCG